MHGNWFIARTLLYLRLNSLRNMVRTALRRVRQPRYLLGAMVVLGYLWFAFLRPGRSASAAFSGNSPFVDTLPLFASLVVLLMLWLQWLVPGKPGLRFSEAEIAFLFPAPFTRRQLIHYRLIDNLLSTMLSALFLMLIFRGFRLGLAPALRSWGAWWLLQGILACHGVAVSLVLARLARRSWSVGVRRAVVAVVGALFLGSLAALEFFGHRDVSTLLLWPGRVLIQPFFSGPGDYLLALLPVFAVLALHYFWVLQLETPFEEQSMDQARKVAERVANYRAGKGLRLGQNRKAQNESFSLHAKLPVEFALMWKNLMVAPAYMNRRVFIVVAFVCTIGIQWLRQQQDFPGARVAAAIGAIAMVLLGYLFAFGPQLATNDLRGEMANADIVKTWPQPGWRIVLGSMLAPMLQLSSIGWLFVLIAGLALRLPPDAGFTLTAELRLGIAAGVAAVLPLLFGLQLLVPNAFLLIFPAWAGAMRPGPGRFDVAGLRLLFFIGQLLFLAISLLPPLFTGGVIWMFSNGFVTQTTQVVLVTVPVFVVLMLEFLFGVYLLGERFDRVDLVAETR